MWYNKKDIIKFTHMNYKKYVLILAVLFQIQGTFAYTNNEVETFYYTTTLETIGKYVDNEHTTLGYLYEYQGFLNEKAKVEFDTEKLWVIYKLLEINSENIKKQLISLDTSKTNIEAFVKYFEGKHPEYQKNIELIKSTQVINSKDENGDTLLKYLIKNGTFADIDFALWRGLNPNNKDKLGNVAFYDFIKTGGKFYPATFIDKLLAGKFDEIGTINVVNNILLKGFNPNLTDAKNENIIFSALELKNPKILKIVLETPGLDLTIKNIDGKNALAYSIEKLFDTTVIMWLINHMWIDVNATDYNWNSALHLLSTKEIDFFKELFKRWVEINKQNKNGENEITKIIIDEPDEKKVIEKYSLLKSYKPLKLDQQDKDGNTAIMKAIQSGKLEVVKELLKDYQPNNMTNAVGQNMLMMATFSSGSIDMVNFLLNQKIDINQKDIDGNTALHYALRNGNYEVIESLFKAGIDINASNNKFENIATFMMEKNDFKLLHLAWEYGIDLTKKVNEDGTNVLWLFAKNDKTDMLKVLFKNKKTKFETKGENNMWENVFSYAIKNKNLELTTLLLQNDFDVNTKNSLNQTPLMFAGEVGDVNIINTLLLANAKVDEVDTTGKNALLYACIKSDENSIKALLTKTTNKKIVDNDGKSCETVLKDSQTISKELYELIK